MFVVCMIKQNTCSHYQRLDDDILCNYFRAQYYLPENSSYFICISEFTQTTCDIVIGCDIVNYSSKFIISSLIALPVKHFAFC
jgi:hypothetical protein